MFVSIPKIKVPNIKDIQPKVAAKNFRLSALKQDVVTITSPIKRLLEVFQGEFGIRSKDSTPLERFPIVQNLKGFSTPPVGGMYLCGDINTPLSTTGLHCCRGLAISDGKKHFLYHVGPNTSETKLRTTIKTVMGEDFNFNRAYIIFGDATDTEANTANMLKVLKEINPEAGIEFRHFSSSTPEIVSYRGNIYEIPTNGKTSFDVVANVDYNF